MDTVTTPTKPTTHKPTVAVIERLSPQGEVLYSQAFDAWPIVLGRALQCDMVLGDATVAPQQWMLDTLQLAGQPAQLHVQALDLSNPSQLRPHPLGQSVAAGHGAILDASGWQMPSASLLALELHQGVVHLRIRTAAMALAATEMLQSAPLENPLPAGWAGGQGKPPWVWVLLSGLLFLAFNGWDLWLAKDPDSGAEPVPLQLAGLLVSLVAWVGLWALVSKLFRRQTHFIYHAGVVLTMGWLASLLFKLLHGLAFSLSWPLLARMDALAWIVIAAGLLHLHLQRVLVRPSNAEKAALLGFAMAAVALTGWSNYQSKGSVLAKPYMGDLYRPALRLATPLAPQALLERVQAMQVELDRRAAIVEPGEDSNAGDDDE